MRKFSPIVLFLALATCLAAPIAIEVTGCVPPGAVASVPVGRLQAYRKAIVGALAGVVVLDAAGQAQYRDATNKLIQKLQASGGKQADYATQVAPIDAQQTARRLAGDALVAALVKADTELVAQEALPAAGDRAVLAQIAGSVLSAAAALTLELSKAGPMPGIPLPPDVQSALGLLGPLAGLIALPTGIAPPPPSDAGAPAPIILKPKPASGVQ